jgi:hypothetical protein
MIFSLLKGVLLQVYPSELQLNVKLISVFVLIQQRQKMWQDRGSLRAPPFYF